MSQLLGPNGRPISSSQFQPKMTKTDAPKTGNAFGNWAGRDITYATLPGGGVVQFDLSKLELSDFRAMLDHYQVNSSLAVLSFMQHQSTFHVECSDKRIEEECDYQLHENWTMLNRAMSQANWAGYSPNALEWENDIIRGKVVLEKVKDLVPEECKVNWKEEEGWAPPGRTPPKFKTFDGIKQFGQPGWPIPVPNSFWYPLLMQNGNYYGKKLLRPAFQPWFFSILVHLFANRYYERFGEPTPIGRAPFDELIGQKDDDNEPVRGNVWLLNILQQLRNRSVVVLPNDKTQMSDTRWEYDYGIEYLESQMRGADFERYLTRLDEEVSLGLFTPILLMRTADVGSYNLGVGHLQMYLWMMNAMNDDRAYYLDRYILSPMTDYNFSPNAPRPKVVFTKLGNQNADMVRDVIVQLIKNGAVKPDLNELGQMVGMTLTEIQQTVKPPAKASPAKEKVTTSARETIKDIVNRVTGQTEKAFREHTFGANTRINMGFKNRMEKAFEADGIRDPYDCTERVFTRMDAWLSEVVKLGETEFSSAQSFVGMFEKVLDTEIATVENANV